ncbi:lysophospholipase [Amycolatopsis sp. NBC_01307]|uniref:alpha/beta hydrolase n=1 Tax=Amycolatopsis sp. NBC_01307 TaxID=2903561 RepID=UPI002E13143A|nr:lysophospholipase [Amycolatopsis sp. NBC_01307]
MNSQVTVEHVRFASSGVDLAGDLFHPASEVDGPRTAVVVAGAWRTVKEQMPARYARELAARGFSALAFDFRSWGASGGRPRSMEDPLAKADDLVAAAGYLAARSDVDRVAGLGICASGAYLASAAAKTSLFSSLALVAPALPSRETVVANLGGPQGVAALRDAGREAREHYERTGEERLEPAVPRTDESLPADYFADPARGAIPAWDNTFNPASWDQWLDYDAQASASRLTVPLLVVHSDAAASPESVREFVAAVPEPVEQCWLDGVTQYDFYDRPGPVKTAADAVARHFTAVPSVHRQQ